MAADTHLQDVTIATGAIVLEDGTAFLGTGCGAPGAVVGELCFNTAVTGYQEILTDPSYAEQILLFTFPHIGNVGANPNDAEFSAPPAARAARGTVFRAPITPPSNWRAADHFDAWLAKSGIIGLSGIDTRALTRRIREQGMPKAAIAHAPEGGIDIPALQAAAAAWHGVESTDLAARVTQPEAYANTSQLWQPRGRVPNA